jgi:predicted RNase H-like nuclease
MRDTTVTGVDGCAAGWVAVTLGLESQPAATRVRATVAKTLDGLPLTGVTGIDMPLGLLDAGWRDADLLARRALGRRGATVFAIPPRAVWDCETYAEANQVCRDLTGKGFSVQAWGLRRKIAEADDFRRRGMSAPVQLYEVHPELSFTAMAGAPVPDSKHTTAGLAVRRARDPGTDGDTFRGEQRLVRPSHRRRPGDGPCQPGSAGRRRRRDRDPLLSRFP